jgi:hypothetical protein
MMLAFKAKAVLAASTLALSAFAVPAAAQQVKTGTSGTAQGTDVSASTCGYGSTTATGVHVEGCADASATNGGTVNTSNVARANERMGMQRSRATAVDDDERARSMTHTRVRAGEVVSSRTMTMYKQQGERPVRDVITSTATPKTTATTKKKK